jgi:hypothetical protein
MSSSSKREYKDEVVAICLTNPVSINPKDDMSPSPHALQEMHEMNSYLLWNT